MKTDEMETRLRACLSAHRFRHSLGVCETAKALALRYGASASKAHTAGLLHDCAKDLPGDELKRLCAVYGIALDDVCESESCLLHAYVGAHLAREVYGVSDGDVFFAIYYHTTGRAAMSLLEKIIFLADMIEPNRANFAGKEALLKASECDLDKAVLMALDISIRHVMDKGCLLHLDTLRARNHLLKTRKDLSHGNNGKNRIDQGRFGR